MQIQCGSDFEKVTNDMVSVNALAYNTFVYSSTDSAALRNIAYQNPIHGGNAVYSARVMLGIDMIDFADEQEFSGSGKRDASQDNAVPVVEGKKDVIEQTKEIQFESFPNPFSNKTTIQLSVPESSKVKLEIYSITGEQKEIIFEGNAEQNKIYTIEYDSKNLAAGVYFYKLSSDSEIMNKKVVIIK